jgi:hypothetical protein
MPVSVFTVNKELSSPKTRRDLRPTIVGMWWSLRQGLRALGLVSYDPDLDTTEAEQAQERATEPADLDTTEAEQAQERATEPADLDTAEAEEAEAAAETAEETAEEAEAAAEMAEPAEEEAELAALNATRARRCWL